MEDLEADRVILEQILRKQGAGGVDWLHVARDTDQWRTAVSTVMKIRVAEEERAGVELNLRVRR